MQKFLRFVEALKTQENHFLLESIQGGFNACFEGVSTSQSKKSFHTSLFYDFLNDLKVNNLSENNTSLIESIEQGVSVLFESSTVSQTLKGLSMKNPFFGFEMKFIKQLAIEKMENKEYNFPETGDTRNPYEYFNEKFADTFLSWVAWNVMKETDPQEVTEKLDELKKTIATIDPNQLDMFGYSTQERSLVYMNEIKKISPLYLEQNKDKYDKLVEDLLYNIPNKEIYNPSENSYHDGSMAGWGEDEHDAYNDLKYQGPHPVADEAVMAWVYYLDTAVKNPEIFKKFKSPDYDIQDATRDANQVNHDNHDKVVEKVSKEVGREKYEEAEVVVEMGNFSWVNSTRQSCSAEGKEMGHCGNEHGPDIEPADELWSLREGARPKDWKSHLTVIINGEDIIPGKRIIKQFVGNGPKTGNARPSAKYHPYILKLLTSKEGGKWIIDGFFLDDYHARHVSFKVSDLSEENQKQLQAVRPELFEKLERADS